MALNQNFRKPETGKKEEEKKPQFSFADFFKTANQKATDYQNNWLSYIRAAMETTNKLNSPFTVNSTTTLSAPSTFAVQGMQKNAAKTPVLGDYVSILEQALAAYGRQRPMDVSKARKLGSDISALDGTDAVGRTMREQVQWDRAAQASGEYDSPDYLTKESIAFPSNKFLKEQADKFTLEKEGRQTAAAEELAYIKNALGITDDAEAQRLWHAAVYDPESFAAEFRTADAAAGQSNPAQEITPAKMIFDLADMYSKNVDQGAIDYADAMLQLITGEQKRREMEGNFAEAKMDPDFAIRSQYIDNYNGNYDERFQLRYNFFGAMPAEYREDDVYHYINNPEFRARYDNEALNTGAGSAQIGGNFSVLGMKGYAQLDDYQREHFNFLWNDEENPAAHEEAMAFLKSIEPSLLARRAKNQEEVLREVTQEAPVFGYVTAAGANLINAALGPTAMVATATGMADENNPLFDSVRATNIPRQELGQAAYDWGYENWGEFGGIIAQGAFNLSNVIVDQMALRTLGGIKNLGRTVNPNVAKTLATALQGSQIATTTIQQELDEGASNEGALLKGALAWGISAFVENKSLDAFMSNPSSAIKYALQNFVIEGAEEGTENVLNTLASEIASLFTGDRSKLGKMYDAAIMETDGDQKAAEELVVGNYLKELSGDVLLGALAGGVMGAPGAVSIANANTQTGTRVLENDAADQLLALAETMPEGSESRKVAENIRKRMKPVTKMEAKQAEAAPEAKQAEVAPEVKQEAPVQQEQDEQAVSEMETTTEAKHDTAETPVAETIEAPTETAQNAPQEAVEEQTADNTQETAQAPETKETPKKKGKRISPAKLGQLYRTLYNDLDAQGKQTVSGVMESSVKSRLAELGEDQASIDEVAAPLAKLLADGTLTNREKQVIARSTNAMRVFNEIRFAEDDTYSSEWVGEAGKAAAEATADNTDTRMELERMLAPKVLRPAVEAAQRTVAESGMAVANAKHGTDAKLGVQLTGEDGKTQDAEILQVTGVTKQGMQVKVKGSDGQTKTVDMADMKFANSDTATIAAYIQKAPHVFTAEEANKMLQTYMGGDVQEHISGFTTLYNAGFDGRAMPATKMTQAEAQLIYQTGKDDAAKAETTRRQNVGTGKRGTGKVTFAPGVIKEKIDKRQRMHVYAVRALAKAGSMNFVLFDSQTMTDGSLLDDYGMPVVNGTYNRKTNTMFIDLSSGKTNEDSSAPYAILRSVSHELTHFMEFNSAEGYAKLKDFVKSEYARKGKSWGKLVEDELKNAAMAMDRETRAAAEGEVIAKAMEMMLQDSKAIERLAQRDQSLYARMKKFIQEYFRKVREAFELIRATSTEAALLLEQDADGIMRYAEKLTKLWDDALVEAVENVQAMGETITSDEAEAEMSETLRILSGLRDGDGDLSFSLKSMKEDYQTYKKMLVTAGTTTDEIDDLFDTIDAVMKKVGENRTELDFGENIGRDDRSFLPVKPNSDPLYKVSLDFSSLCRKRLLQQAVQERLEAKYETVLTKAERVAIRQELLKLQQEGLKIEVACALCYVEAARLKSPAQIAKFMDNKRAQLVDFFSKNSDSYKKAIDAKVAEMTEKLGYEAGTPMAQMSKADKRKVQAEKKAMYTKYMPTEAEERIIRTAEDLPETMYKTSEGLWKLKREHPEIFAAYTTFVRNATKSKGIEGDTPFYAGDSQTISDGLIESMNAENGLRSQSWSDFQVIHVLDYMAAVIEFSTRKAKMQSYTKVPDFVKLMGNTGMMINLSLIPADYDGKNLAFDPVEGMDYAVSKTLRDVYHGTVGNISIGISDPHIKALLASNDIDYVIPYHKSSMDKKTRAAIGLKKWEDYEASQNEKQRDYSITDKNSKQYRKAPKFSEWYNHEEAVKIAKAAQATAPSGDVAYGARVAMREMAERYKQLCHERGLQEKFAQFASEENYWKLLIDRKMIDQVTGELIEQKAVKPVFNTADTLAILDAEVERFAPVKADFEEAASRIEQLWAKGEIRKAAKSKEIQKQVSDYEDTVVILNIVESAAEPVNTEDEGTFVPENPDIRYSRREVTPHTLAYSYMETMQPTTSMNESERWLLDKYQRTVKELQEKQEAYNEQRNLAVNGTNAEERTKAKARANLLDKQMGHLRETLRKAERSEGFATLMNTAQKVAERFMTDENNLLAADASDRLDNELADVQAQLKAITKQLANAEAGQRTAFARGLFNAKALNEAGQNIRKAFNTRMSGKKISNRLALAYAELYAENNPERFAAAMRALAQDVLESSKSRYRSPVLADLKDNIGSIGLSEAQKQELAKNGITISEFKRVVNPVVQVIDGGADLGTIVSSAEYYGTGIISQLSSADSEGDMIMTLYKTIQDERAKEAEAAMEGMTHEESIGYTMAEIMNTANFPLAENGANLDAVRNALTEGIEGNRAIATQVDKALATAKRASASAGNLWRKAAEINSAGKQAVEYYRAIDEQRRLLEQEELVLQLKSEAAQELKKQRQDFRDRMDRDRRVRDMNMKAAQHRKHLAAQVKKLDGLIRHETDYKHVPEDLKPLVETFVAFFANEGTGIVFDKNKADKLANVYRKLREVDGDLYDDDVQWIMDEMSSLLEQELQTRNGKGMSIEERAAARMAIMENLATIADHVYAMVKNANNMFYAGKKAEYAVIGTVTAKQLEQRKDYTTLAGKAGEALRAADNFIRAGNMTPVYFFDQLKNEAFKVLFGDMLAAQDEYAFRIAEAKQFMRDTKKQYHYGSWAKDAALTMTTENGRTVTLDKEDAMSLYAIWKREHADELLPSYHLENGGFVLEGYQTKGKNKFTVTFQTTPNKLTAEDFEQISAYLTAEQKAYADAVVEFMSTRMAEYGNETSMELYGIKKYKEAYYFPMKSSGDQMYQKSTTGGGQVTDDNRVKHRSFTKARVKSAANTLVIGKFSKVAADHMVQMALYSTMTVPIESMNRVLNYKHMDDNGNKTTIRALLEQKYGPEMKRYMETFLTDLNGGIRRDSREGFANKLVSLFKRGSVVASASVVVQQPTAIMRALAMISPKYLVTTAVPHKGDYAELKEHSGVAVLKEMGRFDVDMGAATAEWILEADEDALTVWEKVKQATNIKDFETFKKRWDTLMTAAPGKADEMTWAWLWRAVKAEQAELHPGMDTSSDAFLDRCGERFNDIVNHTQVYDSTLVRSQNMRSKSTFMQMVTSFMAEGTLTANMLYDAAFNNASKGGKKYAVRAVTAVVASQILTALAQALVSAGRDDDEKKTWLEKYAGKAAGNIASNLNPMNMLPMLSDIQSLLDGYDVTRADMSILTEVYKAFKKLDNDNLSPYRKIEELSSIAKLLGIPLKNIMRDARSLVTTFAGNADRPTSGYAVGEAVKGGLIPGYNTKPEAYYEKAYQALAKGDQATVGTIREYMTTVGGKDDNDIDNGIRNRLKLRVDNGEMSKDEAIRWLVEHKLAKNTREAFDEVDKWTDTKAYRESVDDYSYKKYGEIEMALKKGDTKTVKTLMDEMLKYGNKEDDVISAIKTSIGNLYKNGELTKAEATKLYKHYDPKADDEDIFWLHDKWDLTKKNADVDGYSWTKTGAFLDSIPNGGKTMVSEAKKLLDNGVKKGSISSAIKNRYKDQFVELYKKGQAANLLARLLSAYEAIGYNRGAMQNKIMSWLTEDEEE